MLLELQPLALGPGEGAVDSEVWIDDPATGRMLRNVTAPTLTPVLPPPDRRTGQSVIVAPGGAYLALAIEHEGMNIARGLASRGIAAFVLKYRLKPTPADHQAFMAYMAPLVAAFMAPDAPASMPPLGEAVEDGLAALDLVRAQSAQWGLDPRQVGFLGFSAGAITALGVVHAANAAQMPVHLGYIYGPLHASQAVPAGAPPMYSVLAADDILFARRGFGLVEAWQRAGKPVEFHLFERGNHGFGLGREGTTTENWLESYLKWVNQPSQLASP
jgi:acetyl esterase/lipase